MRGERELIVTQARTEKCEHFLSRILDHGIIHRIEYNEGEGKKTTDVIITMVYNFKVADARANWDLKF